MALARLSISVVLLPFTLIALTAASARGQTPAPTAAYEPHRWHVEIYAGTMIASRSGDGLAGDLETAEPFAAVNGRPSAYVPSWYYGYGALLLSAVNTAVAHSSGTIPLDDVMRFPMVQRTHGWHVGARVIRALNRHWSLEIAGGYASNGTRSVDVVAAAITSVSSPRIARLPESSVSTSFPPT